MDAVRSLHLFNRFREEHPGVFLITRNCDAKTYLYLAIRQANVLVDQKVKCMAVLLPDWHKQEPIAEVIMDNFFALKVQTIPNSSKYTATMAAFPQRQMMLNLKKNSSESKSDGTVTATLDFQLSSTVSVENVQLLNMYQEMTFDEMEIPNLTRVHLFGSASKTSVQHLSPEMFAKCCTPFSPTQVLIEEVLEVTDEMRKRFDVKAIAGQWLMSQAKAKLA